MPGWRDKYEKATGFGHRWVHSGQGQELFWLNLLDLFWNYHANRPVGRSMREKKWLWGLSKMTTQSKAQTLTSVKNIALPREAGRGTQCELHRAFIPKAKGPGALLSAYAWTVAGPEPNWAILSYL